MQASKGFQVLGYVLAALFMLIGVLVVTFFVGIFIKGISFPQVLALFFFLFAISYLLIRENPVRNFQKIIIASIVVLLFEITVIGAVMIFTSVGIAADILVILAAIILVYEVLKVEKRVREIYERAKECKLDEEDIKAIFKPEKKEKKKRRRRKQVTPKTSLKEVVSRERERGSVREEP
jgi:membrane-bound ClpP family serine protease